ncbi:uncharacterized protein L3040_002557 [Drepanopeziza brunnea f. sp. 'multigermtubi']|uniref:uncharacterized protein n=1 Tax=Drepanopeziza brunnea f. sp. 'multigermtubi' TaxID=698441 RepID=UPI00239A6DA0|nr:hypothetical protein L3040_002557 [Drepanopeziza brunnea f. sp. 'multigermtubi']
MRSSRCVSSIATALHKIFILPLEHRQSQFAIRTTSTSSTSFHSTLLSPPPIQYQQRRYASKYKATEKPTTAEKSRLPRDDEIRSWSVSLVDENGRLCDPRPTHDVLATIDRKVSTLVVVVPADPHTHAPPICKIFNKQALRESETARLKAAKGGGVTTKTMELNWAIGANDLGHRMGKLKGWLEKGWRVEVLVAGKRKGRKANEEEAEGVLGAVRGVLAEAGGKETKPMEGKVSLGEGKGLGTVTLYLEGKVKKEGAEKSGEAGDAKRSNEEISVQKVVEQEIGIARATGTDNDRKEDKGINLNGEGDTAGMSTEGTIVQPVIAKEFADGQGSEADDAEKLTEKLTEQVAVEGVVEEDITQDFEEEPAEETIGEDLTEKVAEGFTENVAGEVTERNMAEGATTKDSDWKRGGEINLSRESDAGQKSLEEMSVEAMVAEQVAEGKNSEANDAGKFLEEIAAKEAIPEAISEDNKVQKGAAKQATYKNMEGGWARQPRLWNKTRKNSSAAGDSGSRPI